VSLLTIWPQIVWTLIVKSLRYVPFRLYPFLRIVLHLLYVDDYDVVLADLQTTLREYLILRVHSLTIDCRRLDSQRFVETEAEVAKLVNGFIGKGLVGVYLLSV